MDSRDQRGAVKAIVDILRRLTRIVQLVPFVYLFVYAAYLLFSWLLPEGILGFLDSLIFISPATSGGLLILSRLLKLCRWHKTAILIPLSSQIESYIDSLVFTFTESEIIFINLLLGTIAFAFLLFANKHFLFHGRKENSH